MLTPNEPLHAITLQLYCHGFKGGTIDSCPLFVRNTVNQVLIKDCDEPFHIYTTVHSVKDYVLLPIGEYIQYVK